MIQQHGSKRRNTSACSDKYRPPPGMSKSEVAERLMDFHFVAWIQFEEPTRNNALGYTIQAEGEPIASSRRRDRIGASGLLPIFAIYNRDKLAWREREIFHTGHLEFKMVHFRREFFPVQ